MNEEELQKRFNMHLRRNVVFTYIGNQYNAGLNLTTQNMYSLKILQGIDDVEESKFLAIEEYLKKEGFFDIDIPQEPS